MVLENQCVVSLRFSISACFGRGGKDERGEHPDVIYIFAECDWDEAGFWYLAVFGSFEQRFDAICFDGVKSVMFALDWTWMCVREDTLFYLSRNTFISYV